MTLAAFLALDLMVLEAVAVSQPKLDAFPLLARRFDTYCLGHLAKNVKGAMGGPPIFISDAVFPRWTASLRHVSMLRLGRDTA